MKKVLLFAILTIFMIDYGYSQTGINYKALVKDNSGNILSNQTITVQFTVLQGLSLTNVYQETHNPTTDINGIIILNIGLGNTDSGDFETIDWSVDDHFLNIQIDTGSGLTDLGTTQFMAVPYALSVSSESQRIDDLIDGKSDVSGSSIFIGLNSGINDDGNSNQNTGLGYETMKNSTSGNANVALGWKSLAENISGNVNTAVGANALGSNTSATGNSAFGAVALGSNITGQYNVAMGYFSLKDNTTGGGNVAIGNFSMFDDIDGDLNVALGINSLYHNVSSNSNVSVGSYALEQNVSGNGNLALGKNAGHNNENGSYNVFIGNNAGYFETNDQKLYIQSSESPSIWDDPLVYGEFDNNIFRVNGQFQIGSNSNDGYYFPLTDGTQNQVLQTDGDGSLNWVNLEVTGGASSLNDLSDAKSDNDGIDNGSSLFLGVNSGLNDNETNNKNVGVGYESMSNNFDGYENTSLGYQSLYSNVSAERNVALGYRSLYNHVDGTGNVALGYQSLFSNTMGYSNISIGYNTMYNNITGYDNVIVGSSSFVFNTTGFRNTSIGKATLFDNTIGSYNSAYGYEALKNNTTGEQNTGIGGGALLQNTQGIRNTAVGYAALINNIEGSNNIAIGAFADVPNGSSDNQVRIGNTSITYAGIQVAWTVTSDRRWKEQIRELPYGLDLVKQLKPVDYYRKNNDNETREIGFIAQDLETLLEKVGYNDQGFLTEDDKGYMSVRYNDFIPLLTKALQEQQELIEKQKATIDTLTSKLSATQENQTMISERLADLEKLLKASN